MYSIDGADADWPSACTWCSLSLRWDCFWRSARIALAAKRTNATAMPMKRLRRLCDIVLWILCLRTLFDMDAPQLACEAFYPHDLLAVLLRGGIRPCSL